MAKFTTSARVSAPDDKGQGLVLQRLLEWSHGAYEYKLILPPRFKEDIQRVANLTSDAALLEIVRRGEILVSLEELRGVDLQSKVIVEAHLNYEPGEAEALGGNAR